MVNETENKNNKDSIKTENKNSIEVKHDGHSSILLSGVNSLLTYVEENGKLPEYITINKYNFSIPEFLYLLKKATATENIYKNNKNSIKTGNKNNINSIEVKYDDQSSILLSGVKPLLTYFKENSKLPDYITVNTYNFSIAEFLY